jgi:hypothetical protein
MEGRDAIQQYLDQLRLSLRIPEAGRILIEAEDHLRQAAAAATAAGLSEAAAQQEAIRSFGPVQAVVYAHQTRHGRIAAMLADVAVTLWQVAPFYLVGDCALRLAQLLTGDAAATVTDVLACALMGPAGVALWAAYLVIRGARRRRGELWVLPLGGYFPLAAVIGSTAVLVLMLVLTGTGAVAEGHPLAVGLDVTAVLAVGLTLVYGTRMVRLLRQQARVQGRPA